MLSQCVITYPLRPPNWRHQLVEHGIQAGDTSLTTAKDAATKRLYSFRKMLRRGGRYRACAKNRYSDYYSALEIYHDRQSNVRWIVEARLLSGEPIEIITKKLGVHKKAVVAYVHHYFDVVSRLECEDFIHGHVLTCSVGDGNVTEYAMRLKQIAYRDGPSALDVVLSGEPSGSDEKVSRKDETIKLLEGLLYELASGPNASAELSKMQSIVTTLRQLSEPAESAKKGGARDLNDVEKSIDVFLKEIPWSIGRKNIPPELAEWKDTAVELRADETLCVTHGQKLENEEWLKSVKAPSALQDGETNAPPKRSRNSKQ